jgi:hypothetical protein
MYPWPEHAGVQITTSSSSAGPRPVSYCWLGKIKNPDTNIGFAGFLKKIVWWILWRIFWTGFPHNFAKNDRQDLKLGCSRISMRRDASYNLCSKLGSKLIFWRNYGNFSFARPFYDFDAIFLRGIFYSISVLSVRYSHRPRTLKSYLHRDSCTHYFMLAHNSSISLARAILWRTRTSRCLSTCTRTSFSTRRVSCCCTRFVTRCVCVTCIRRSS